MAEQPCRVYVTHAAERDLDNIFAYRRRHCGEDDARTLIASLLARMRKLEHFPRSGAIPPELADLGIREYRQITLPPYRLVYRMIEGNVYIYLVSDGRRDMQTLLEQRLLA